MTGLEMRYFVLKPKGDNAHARASREAMRAYANHLTCDEGDVSDFPAELTAWADREAAAAKTQR